MKKEYYLGLDIGTNSVGWAVTDKEYNLCRFKGKDMWGIRLFESAETAADRRSKRANRRRLQRRKQRIKLLQMLFAEEVQKIDPTFFIRLNESKLHLDDKSTDAKYSLFAEKGYTDIDYYKDYPTIYHLRKALIEDDDPKDIRLVYLALHHIIKSRGHFLIDGQLSVATSFGATLDRILDEIRDNTPIGFDVADYNKVEEILKGKSLAKSEKAKRIESAISLCYEAEDKEILKKQKAAIKEVCKLIVGNQVDLKKMFYDIDFDIEDTPTKFKLSDSKYDEKIVPELESKYPEVLAIIQRIKTLYDWSVLVDVLDDNEYISQAKVKQYEQHKANLNILKTLFKKYLTKEDYKDFFDGIEGATYSNYINTGSSKGNKKNAGEELFYNNLKKILNDLREKVDPSDASTIEYLLVETEANSLLPLQRSKQNSVVPMQVHKQELDVILNKASKHYAFLNKKDEQGLTVADKVRSIFEYRIPYFVGPLSDRHKEYGANVWAERKESGYIYPWNIQEKIDYEKSNEAFINRMTNKCTYLPWEDVVPKNSLLYQKYMVLNELNNLTIRGNKLGDDVILKQRIYHNLFEKEKKVTRKKLLTELQLDDSELTEDLIGGIDGDFKSALSSYITFKNQIFGERIKEAHIQEICEDIIKWATIFGDDSKMLESIVRKHYGSELTEKQIKTIRQLRFSGWGQFSNAFIKDIEGSDKETGEVFSIIGGLWNTNNNLMQLLSSRYTFDERIKELKDQNLRDISRFSYEEVFKDVYTSPANKRSIWQALQIVEEIRKVMGSQPKKIFVEMARGAEKQKKRTESRKQQLISLYEACKNDTREWKIEEKLEKIKSTDERDFSSIKLYLYYTQLGKCAYSGEDIDLDSLMNNNSRWDRDHIYPQSKIKDDSLDNLVLANKKYNGEKDNRLIPFAWQKKMQPTWKMWLDRGLISQKKYDRLIRKEGFTDDELSGFIARQLVETRQSTKIVADLLESIYKESRIVRVKSGLVSDFRKAPLNILKSRRVNDYHHAKDAYLNIVVGNVYNTRFTDNPREWVKKNRDENWSINKVFYYDVKGAWIAPEKQKGKDNKMYSARDSFGDIHTGTIDTVRTTVKKNSVLYTEYSYCDTGGLFDETLQKKGKTGIMPLKKGLDTNKYGGYISPSTSYFAQVEFDGKKGERVKIITGVPIYVANLLGHNKNAFIEYCQEKKGMKNVKVIFPMIKKNSLLVINGFPMRIRGENENQLLLKGNMQLVVKDEYENILRRVEKLIDKNREEVIEEFDKLSSEDLLKCYGELILKLKEGAYKNRPANQANNLETQREEFSSLTDIEKARVIDQVLNMFRCDATTTSNLTLVGGSANAGNIAINKNTVGKADVVLINQSITGLFENRVKL